MLRARFQAFGRWRLEDAWPLALRVRHGGGVEGRTDSKGEAEWNVLALSTGLF